ncbi:putative uncharacterized protein [Eubacterium sp. CAG:76]|nr:putative uncharacterized protein [Eubacterium sp. CAG:76]
MSRNKLQKVLDIKFIIAVIIIILLCAVLVYTRKEAKSNYVSDEKITEIGFENIGELATQSVTTTTVRVETKDLKLFNVSIPLTQSKYIYTYNTTIKAGINFSDVKWQLGDTDDTSHNIYVDIPEVKTLSADIDLDSFKVLHEENNFFSPITLTEHNDSLIQLRENALSDAINSGLYDRALDNAKTILTSFISQVYPSNEYSIIFSERASE